MKTLHKWGPSIDPCGTPLWMSAQLLRTLLTFICCFLFDKYDFSNDTELYLKLHKLTICLAVWHVVGNQKPLKGSSELMLYNNFCLGLHANLLEV